MTPPTTGVRETIRAAAIPRFLSSGIEGTSTAVIAEAAGVTEAEVLDEFGSAVGIALATDHFDSILTAFVDAPAGLSPSAAWIVALDETMSEIDTQMWNVEQARQKVIAADPLVALNAITEIGRLRTSTVLAVSSRSGLPVESPKVSAFAGALLGALTGTPTTHFEDAASYIQAHADAFEVLGPALDRLLH